MFGASLILSSCTPLEFASRLSPHYVDWAFEETEVNEVKFRVYQDPRAPNRWRSDFWHNLGFSFPDPVALKRQQIAAIEKVSGCKVNLNSIVTVDNGLIFYSEVLC